MPNKAKQPGLHENGRSYEYYAFISYKHLDKAWGKWVQHGLERYRLPTRLCRSGDVPKHVSPVFRDETDLTGGRTVHDHLLDKIGKSKYLIVICSRNMQNNPQYIDYEVESFLAAGNPAARILPLIVDGEANSKDPAKECLPPSLLKMGDKMPLGVTVNPKNKKEAILKLVAAILELELQTLRAHNQERKQKRIVAALSGGLAFSLGLGAFMGWQVLKVTESGLHEQLTYAEDVFRQGDHLSAHTRAEEIAAAYNPLMEEEIRTAAEKLSVMSAITPKYLPMTALCDVTADSHLLFTRDGQQVMVITQSTVRKYNMQGEMTMEFATSQTVNHIVDVSADGVHAVVMTVYQPGYDGTHLWLWNMETNEMVTHLVGSAQYDENDENMGYLRSVVNARFSPDGSMVCAWQDAQGYFNPCAELAAWDSTTGKKLFSFSGTLLGNGAQDYEVTSFEFIGDDTFHWEGTANHVYYTLGDAEPQVLSNRALPAKRDAEKVKSLYGQRCTYRRARGETEQTVTDLLTGRSVAWEKTGDEGHIFLEAGNRWVLCAEMSGNAMLQLTLIDLEQMAAVPAPELAQFTGEGMADWQAQADSPFIYLYWQDGLYQLDCRNASVMRITLDSAGAYELKAHMEGKEILAAEIGGRVHIAELVGDMLYEYVIDEDVQRFWGTAAFPAAADAPCMAANHGGDYYLYPLLHPGEQLSAEQSGDVSYAASPDGALTVAGGETTLAAWLEGKQILMQETASPVRAVGAAQNSFFALTGDTLTLYNLAGEEIASCMAGEGERMLADAKITRDGQRMAVVSRWDHDFSSNVYTLHLLDGQTLEEIALVSEGIHIAPASDCTVAFDLSPDGKYLAGVESVGRVTYANVDALRVSLWSAADGTLLAQTEAASNGDVPLFDLSAAPAGEASNYRLQYVRFSPGGKLLSGLQYGTWVFDPAELRTEQYLSESTGADALPVLLSSGALLYPSEGLHVWQTGGGALSAVLYHPAPATGVNAMLKPINQDRLYVSGDERWVTISGGEDAWLYAADDWSSAALAATPVQVLHLDDDLLVYAADGALYRLTLK